KKKCEKVNLSLSDIKTINSKEVVLIGNRLVVYLSNHYWHDLKRINSAKKHKTANSGGDKLKSIMKKVASDLRKEELECNAPYRISFSTSKEERIIRLATKVIK